MFDEEAQSAKADALSRALSAAKPSWLTDGHGITGPRIIPRRPLDARRFSTGSVEREPIQPPFPAIDPESVSQVTAGGFPNIAFLLSNASTTVNNVPVRKVKIYDGKIKGEFPSGMGYNNYVLPVSNTPNNFIIHAGATFNPQTLVINSRFLDSSTAAAFPESRVEDDLHGFLYWQIGFTYLDAKGALQIVNTRVGDINFELVYSSQNGQPALLPVNSDPGFLDLAFMP